MRGGFTHDPGDSNLKTGKARAIRFTTLDAICATLDCQPGDLIEYRPNEDAPHGEKDATNE